MTISELNTTLQQLRLHFNGTLKENQDSLRTILETLSDLVDSLAQAKVKKINWKYHSETLVNKIIFTSYSIIQLSEGYVMRSYKTKDFKVDVTDYQSIYILTRAMIENYVTLCYIYNNDLSEEEKLFRFKLWEVSGLISRQNFSGKNEDYQKKKEEEKVTIDKIMEEIKGMEEYAKLDKTKLNKLSTYGLPRLDSWQQLIRKGNLRKDIIGNCYSLFSNYAHSEYLSIIQVGQSSMNSKNGDNIGNIQASLTVVRIINSMTIHYYATHFKAAELVYNTFPGSIRNAVEIARKIGEENTAPNKVFMAAAGDVLI